MRIHRRKSQFGWPGDGGLGLRLIERIKIGAKTATCCPVVLRTAAEIERMWESVGHVATVVDRFGTPHCNIRIVEVIETTWGTPDPRLVRREEHESVESWRAAMSSAWAENFRELGTALSDDSRLLAELFELAEE